MARACAARRRQLAASIHRHLLAGRCIVLLLAGGVGGWAATTEIVRRADRAGLDRRRFQRQEGAAPDRRHRRQVARARRRSRQGGRHLVRLDETVMRANLAIVTKGLDELGRAQARLEAERDGADRSRFRPSCSIRPTIPTSRDVMASEAQAVPVAAHGAARAEGAVAAAHRAARTGNRRHRRAASTPRTRRSTLIRRELVGVRELYAAESRADHRA